MQLADTSWLVALLQEADCHHEGAVTLYELVRLKDLGPILVTEAVILETLQVLKRRYGTSQSCGAAAVGALCASERFAIGSVASAALAIAAARPALGYVDALLLARFRSDGVDVLTFDDALDRALVRERRTP